MCGNKTYNYMKIDICCLLKIVHQCPHGNRAKPWNIHTSAHNFFTLETFWGEFFFPCCSHCDTVEKLLFSEYVLKHKSSITATFCVKITYLMFPASSMFTADEKIKFLFLGKHEEDFCNAKYMRIEIFHV